MCVDMDCGAETLGIEQDLEGLDLGEACPRGPVVLDAPLRLTSEERQLLEAENDKVLQVSYWEQKLNSEKLRLEQLRENQEKEL